MKNEDELMRHQRLKCMGCGERLSAGLFGLDRNFWPCRYLGGLFCRRWCHSDDHRIIPHRVLFHWDFHPHRVSKQSAAFLDQIYHKPLLTIQKTNPLLFEGIPALRSGRDIRRKIARLFEPLIEIDPLGVRDAVAETVGCNRYEEEKKN